MKFLFFADCKGRTELEQLEETNCAVYTVHSLTHRSVLLEVLESTEGQALKQGTRGPWAGTRTNFAVLSRLLTPSPAFLLTGNPSSFRCKFFGDGRTLTIQMHKFRARDFQAPIRWSQKQR